MEGTYRELGVQDPAPSLLKGVLDLSQFIPLSWSVTSEECPGHKSDRGGSKSLVHALSPLPLGLRASAGPGEPQGGSIPPLSRGVGGRAGAGDPQPAVGHTGWDVSCGGSDSWSGPGKRAFPAQQSQLSCAPASLLPPTLPLGHLAGVSHDLPGEAAEPQAVPHRHLEGDSSEETGPWGRAAAEERTATGAWPAGWLWGPEPPPLPSGPWPRPSARLSSAPLNSSLRKDQSSLEKGQATLMAASTRDGRGRGTQVSGDGGLGTPSLPHPEQPERGQGGQNTAADSQPPAVGSVAPSCWDRGATADRPQPAPLPWQGSLLSSAPSSLSGTLLPPNSLEGKMREDLGHLVGAGGARGDSAVPELPESGARQHSGRERNPRDSCTDLRKGEHVGTGSPTKKAQTPPSPHRYGPGASPAPSHGHSHSHCV